MFTPRLRDGVRLLCTMRTFDPSKFWNATLITDLRLVEPIRTAPGRTNFDPLNPPSSGRSHLAGGRHPKMASAISSFFASAPLQRDASRIE